MAYPLDGPVYDLGPLDHHLEDKEIELDGADIKEIIQEDITDRIELMPEYAKQVEESAKIAMVHAIGAMVDSAILLGIDKDTSTALMNKTIELLKERKLYY